MNTGQLEINEMKSKVHFAKVSNRTRHKVAWKGFLTRTSRSHSDYPWYCTASHHKNTEINQKPPEYGTRIELSASQGVPLRLPVVPTSWFGQRC